MVVFMLDDSRNDSAERFFMLFEIFVLIFNYDIRFAENILANIGNTQTAFVESPLVARFLKNFCIDKNSFKGGNKLLFLFRKIFIILKRGCVNNKKTDWHTNLGRSQTDAAGLVHGFKHIYDKLVQFWIFLCYFFRFLS